MSIQVRHVSKTFGTFGALKDVSLAVKEGELVALLGPSGSGKTTLLRIIAGLEAPDETQDVSILCSGQDIARDRSTEPRVGFVFQHYALFRHMNVFENIAFGLRVRPKATRPSEQEIRSRVETLLQLIQLENLANRYPNQLSGGQRQRVALARALAIEPKVLLLDEPFGALDAKVRQGLRRWLRQLHDEINVTTVLVTHDQDEALEVADRIVIMNHGKIEQVGTPEEVFHHPANEFVIDFLGSVNLFHGRVEQGAIKVGDLTLTQATGSKGESARVFVRPHELEISRDATGAAGIRAKVLRVHGAGPTVKVDLKGTEGQDVLVEMNHTRAKELNLKLGEEVVVTPLQSKVFEEYVEDYTI